MNQKTKVYFLKYIIYLLLGGMTLFYFMVAYGTLLGIHLATLTWSLYILCIPSAHGQYLIGAPIFFLFKKPLYTEPLMWSMAIMLNAITYLLTPGIYLKIFPTYLLLRIISLPNPYWFIIGVAACGTFYNMIAGEHYFVQQKYKHYLTRHLLILGGIFIFFYLSHQEMIILLNAIL